MAMVLETFIPNFINLLAQIATTTRHESTFAGVLDEFGVNLRLLITSFNDAINRRSRSDLAFVVIIEEIKDVLYSAADMDIFQFKYDKRRGGCYAFSCHLVQTPHNVRSRHIILLLSQKLKRIMRRSVEFGYINNFNHYENPRATRHVNPMNPSSIVQSSDIVGEQVEHAVTMLSDIIMHTSTNIKIIAIVGAAGIGKSTLAKKIFDSPPCQQHFMVSIWLSVTGSFNEVDLLKTILRSLGDDRSGSYGYEDIPNLLSRIQLQVQDRRILLVLDDVWSSSPWNGLLRVAFCYSGCDSVILVTTRNRQVAADMKSTYVHTVQKLNPEAAWSLLKKKVTWGDRAEPHIDRLREIGIKIVQKCDCSPLAIQLVAEDLKRKNKTKSAWLDVLNNYKWSESGLPPELNESIYLSYDDLHPLLKQFFLYCGIFAEDEIINYDKVVQMLMAEEFFLPSGTSELPEALGLEYFRELVTRNLLEPSDGNYDQSHFAIMPNVLRLFALYIAREEALLVEDGKITTARLPKIRRVSVSKKGAEYSDLQTHNNKSIRALISFGNMVIKPGDSLSALPHLRILHVNKTKVGTLVDSLRQLKLLRYLDLSNTDVSALPQDIGKMKNLHYISLHGCPNLAHLPKSIVNLERLRYLDISETRVMTVPRDFGRLVNLVFLKGFPSYVDDNAKSWCTIEELGQLHQLMHLTIRAPENISSSSSSTCAKLSEKIHLRSLWICCTSNDAYEQHNQEVFDELRPSPSLEDLTITGYFGRHLPGWLLSSTLENLRLLKLENLRSCTQLPCSFGQLPNLESLCIKHALAIRRIGEEFFVPSSALVSDSEEEEIDNLISRHYDSMTASTIVFPKLRKLVFYGMLEWKEWDWDAQLEAMHALESIQISRCRLSRLPPGLACQTTALRVITVEKVKDLISLENFSSVVELYLHSVSNIEKIANLPKMKKLKISNCPKLKELEAVDALSSIELKDQEMSTLPAYLQVLQLSQLQIECNLRLLHFISLKDAALEWDKVKHIEQLEAYADGYQQTKRCSVLLMRTSHMLIHPLHLQYKDLSHELVHDNLTIRNDGPSMDEKDKQWSIIVHGVDGSKHTRIEDDAAKLP